MEIRSDIEIAVVGAGFVIEWRGDQGEKRRGVCLNRDQLVSVVRAAADDIRRAQKLVDDDAHLMTRKGDAPFPSLPLEIAPL